MQAAAAEDHFFKAWHLLNDEITCHRNNALYCAALPGSRHEVKRIKISSLYSKHGLMDVGKYMHSSRSPDVPQSASLLNMLLSLAKTCHNKEDIRYTKTHENYRAACQNTVHFHLTPLGQSWGDLWRWESVSRQRRCGFKRVPPGLWLGNDACIFQQYLPDSGPMRDSNSQAKVKKKKEQMSA